MFLGAASSSRKQRFSPRDTSQENQNQSESSAGHYLWHWCAVLSCSPWCPRGILFSCLRAMNLLLQSLSFLCKLQMLAYQISSGQFSFSLPKLPNSANTSVQDNRFKIQHISGWILGRHHLWDWLACHLWDHVNDVILCYSQGPCIHLSRLKVFNLLLYSLWLLFKLQRLHAHDTYSSYQHIASQILSLEALSRPQSFGHADLNSYRCGISKGCQR